MAVTKIIPIRATIQKSVDYICNPAKTEDCRYVYSEQCIPETAGLEFKHYLNQTRAGGNTIGRHLIQSFAPGEVSPEAAHEIGKKLAAEILKGEYAYVLATHVDRGHIHNHFVWCAANTVTHRKYRSNKRTYHNIRDASDKLCKEYELSVIVPQGVGKNYAEWQAEKAGTSWKEKLRECIDIILSESTDFNDFLRQMETRGYEIKQGKLISFRALEQKRFIRAKSLGDDYTESALRHRFAENAPAIQDDYAAFEQRYMQVIHEQTESASALNAIEKRVKGLSQLRENIVTLHRTKGIYQQYTGTKLFREKFYRENEAAITAYRAAKKSLSSYKRPLSSVGTIDKEITRLQAMRPELYQRYNQLGDELKRLEPLRKNLYSQTKAKHVQQDILR